MTFDRARANPEHATHRTPPDRRHPTNRPHEVLRAPRSSFVFQGFLATGQNVAPSERDRQNTRSEEHTSELQSRSDIVCRLLLEKKNCSNEFFLSSVPKI